MTFFSGLLPYTQAERDADERERREARARAVLRRAVCRSGQDYNRPVSAAWARLWARIGGDRD